VYFVPEETPDGAQVFMHCPWRPGPGVAFADYSLNLPATDRVRLQCEIGLRAGARGTDGVTYRVKDGTTTLFEKHCTWKEFRPFEGSLAGNAGKDATLRLEVDPGPARNSTDDWSLWRNVLLLAGTDEQIAASKARAEAEAAKLRAADVERGRTLAEISLLPLTAHRSDSVCPSVLRPTKLSVSKEGDLYVFRCRGDQVIEYRFDPRQSLLTGVAVLVDGTPLDPSPFFGGPRVYLDGREFSTPTKSLGTELTEAQLAGQKLTCAYRYTNPETGSTATLTAILWPEGKSLGMEVRGEPDRFSGFTAKPYGGREVPTPFAVGGPPVWRREGVYVSTVADVMASDASGVGRDGVTYTPLTNSKRNAMRDRFYLTVAGRYEETLSNLTHQPSPSLADLAHRVVLDGWNGPFADDEKWLQDMAAYSVTGFLMIKHVWQRDGYDQTYPNVMPANAAQGGDKALRSLSLAAQKLGHRFCVHENFYDYYPNAEAFRQEDCALDTQGKTIPGWDNGTVRAVILKPSKLMDYAHEFTPEVKRRYECDAAYHDIMPTWHVDFDANAPHAGKVRVTHEQTRALCDFDRRLFGGPVVFEAADPTLAGVYDGGSNHGVDTYTTPVAVAYELLKVHPRMSNHGFGYYERWLPWGYGPGWGTYVMTDRELDKYRAYQVAFGRTGFVGQQLMKHPHGVVREYHLMQAFARAYAGKLVQHLQYRVDGQWVDAGTAARYGQFDALHVEYEGGQHVYVNLAAAPVQVDRHQLPQYGVLTFGPRAEAWTARRDSQVCDFAKYDDVTYADARSHVWQLPATLPPVEPTVTEPKQPGGQGKEFELTVNWKVSRKLDRDYTLFWHFRHNGKIEFQADHKPNKPTTNWQVNETVVDGPIRLSVKDDADATGYDFVVGMYDADGRVPLVRGADEVVIGRLAVKREGAEATSVTLEPTAPDRTPGADPQEYRAGANTARNVLDFGALATNGAVVMRSTKQGRELTPVPIGAVMTLGLAGEVRQVLAVGAQGRPLPAPKRSRHGGKTWFDTTAEAEGYRAAK